MKCLLRSKASLATRTQTAPFPSPGVSVSATGTNIKNLGSPSNCSSPSLLQHLTSNPGVSSLLRTKEETFEALQPMRFPQQLNSAIAVWVCFIKFYKARHESDLVQRLLFPKPSSIKLPRPVNLTFSNSLKSSPFSAGPSPTPLVRPQSSLAWR